MIENGLFQWILANEPLQELMQSGGGLYMGVVPPDAPNPSLMFLKITGKHDTTLDGPSGYVERRYQFTGVGTDLVNQPGSGYVLTQTLMDTLRQQLNGLTGTLPDGTRLFNSILDTEVDHFDEDDQRYYAVQDYVISFQQNP